MRARSHSIWWPFLLFMALGLCSCAAQRGNSISRALFVDGRLWLLSDDGDFSSIAPGAKSRVDAGLGERVLDACVADGALEVLTWNKPFSTWWVRTWKDGRWSRGIDVPSQGDGVGALSCAPGRRTVVTERRLVEIVDGRVTSVELSERMWAGLVTSVHVTAEHVFVGLNAGEWGGGLRRIDRKTGKVSVIEKNASGELCGGPLNSECDPVNGIAEEPWRPQCMAVAIGQVHFFPSGRITEVCDDSIRRLFVKEFGKVNERIRQRAIDEPVDRVAFFSLVRSGNELLAAGIDGIYRFDGSAPPTMTPLPNFHWIDGVAVSFDIPGVVLVLTGINSRRSVSGIVPIMIPR